MVIAPGAAALLKEVLARVLLGVDETRSLLKDVLPIALLEAAGAVAYLLRDVLAKAMWGAAALLTAHGTAEAVALLKKVLAILLFKVAEATLLFKDVSEAVEDEVLLNEALTALFEEVLASTACEAAALLSDE